MTVIARSAESEGDLIDWWEEEELDGDVQVFCAPNEEVIFLSGEDVLLSLPPGRHAITAETHEALEDWLDGDDESIAVAFLTTTPVKVEVAGSFTRGEDEAFFTAHATLRITDASDAIALLEQLGEDESLEDWLGDEIALHVTAAIDERTKEQLLELTSGAFNEEISEAALPMSNEALEDYSITVSAIADLEYQLEEESQKRIFAQLDQQAAASAGAVSGGRRAWHCPKHGTTQAPGACPVCGAPLVEIS